MGRSWIAVINLSILITASVVVNMQGHTSPGTVKQTTEESTDSVGTSLSPLTTEPATDGASGTNTIHPTIDNGTDSEAVNGTDNETDSTPLYEFPEPAYRAYAEYDMYIFLRDYAHWINAFPGIFLNLFCVIVTITMKPFNTTSLFMLALAITDFCAVTIRFIYKFRVGYISEHFDCTMYFSILGVALTFSNFILVVWTIERLIAVRFPLKVQTLCSMKNTKIAVTITFLLATIVSIPYYLYSRTDAYGGCIFTEFILTKWTLVDNAYYVWIPLVTIWLSNMVIIYSMQQTRKSHAKMTQNVESIEKRRKEQTQLTFILLSICFSFVIFHIPQIIASAIERRFPDPLVLYDDPKAFISYFAYVELAYSFTYLQNNINFLLYCSTGRKFRQQFIRLLCFCFVKHRRSVDGTSVITNATALSQSG